jgi:glycine/D-amino acid oxidase-like deaminating enzyme
VKKHYDVVVLGRSIGALTAAAILARRDFTVLVLGNGAPPPAYTVMGHTLHRRAFAFLAASSPGWTRVVTELAQSQTWKRRGAAANPMLQAVARGLRLDVQTDARLFAREVDREFPELYRVVEQLYENLARVNQAADEAFDREVLWPPGTSGSKRTAKCCLAPSVHAEPTPICCRSFRAGAYRRLVRAA